jgi:hypothetical protein
VEEPEKTKGPRLEYFSVLKEFEYVFQEIPGSYDILIGMDWLEKHHDVLYCHNKTFTCIDKEGKQSTVKGVPRPISVRDISALQLKRCFRKGCQLYVSHVEEPEIYKGAKT